MVTFRVHTLIRHSRRLEVGWEVFCERRIAYSSNGSRTANSVKRSFRKFRGLEKRQIFNTTSGGIPYLGGGFGLSKVKQACHSTYLRIISFGCRSDSDYDNFETPLFSNKIAIYATFLLKTYTPTYRYATKK
jgi:hypothetical protein